MNLRCTMRGALLIAAAVVLLSGTGYAQVVVRDSSVTIRNAITAVLKEYLLQVQMDLQIFLNAQSHVPQSSN